MRKETGYYWAKLNAIKNEDHLFVIRIDNNLGKTIVSFHGEDATMTLNEIEFRNIKIGPKIEMPDSWPNIKAMG